jgi:hypothetical protein
MEQVVEYENMLAALRRVQRNKGAAGMDEMSVGELTPYLRSHWKGIREELLSDTYKPKPVRRVEIPKPDGGERLLGIPTVLDRLIQQALLQVLTPVFDPEFSEHSYGFRPGRSAHQAVEAARKYVEEGYRHTVDIDLEKFFDRVNHDMLMARVARKVKDKRVLRLIRGYLQAGVMVDGVCIDTEEGTPQGGPLSPLLANIILDDLDKELEKRGHKFCRYADDCNICVKTPRAGGDPPKVGVGNGEGAGVRGEETQTQGQREEEQDGQTLEAEVPRTYVHSEQETQDTDSPQGAGEVQGAHQGDNREKQGHQHERAAGRTQHLPSGMDWVLPAGGHRERYRESR